MTHPYIDVVKILTKVKLPPCLLKIAVNSINVPHRIAVVF